MSRLIFLTLLLAFIGFTSAQVGQVNTPSDKIATGANVIITWMYTQQVNQIPGTLSCVDNSTKNTVLLSSTVDLSAQSYTWSVNVPAGTYYLALNDGSGDKYSGTFSVFNAGLPASPASAVAPAVPTGPPSTASPAPAPGQTNPPAPASKSSTTDTRTSESSKQTTTPTSLSSSATSFTKSSTFGYKYLLSLIMVATVMMHFV